MKTETVFLDSNVFMYAAGSAHPYKESCLRILADVETGILRGATNAEVLQEILYRFSHLRAPESGIKLCRAILDLPLTILPVTGADVRLALDLLDNCPDAGLQPRDAIHCATMRNAGISRALTADKAWECVEFITRIDPLTYSLGR